MLIILPDSGAELLRRELAHAFTELGHRVRRAHPAGLLDERSPDYLPALLESGPDLFFSVNLQGLLPGGRVPELLRQAGVPALAWFVDNPWHLLSGMRGPSWKNFYLAVTDHTFIDPLSEAAATAPGVFHLPLAACPHCLEAGLARPARPAGRDGNFGSLEQVVFAGRSAFPEREAFFSGQNVPAGLLEEAEKLCREGVRPDFAWWLEKLGLVESRELWPGKKARAPGLGAAESNRAWRGQRLGAALSCGLTVFGDQGWSALGPGLDLRPPFDYYARAHEIYRQAAFSLNLDSLLMNAGLSQRIFDVWPAGGFCLTDNSPGLEIFPSELTGPVTFTRPEELPDLVEKFRAAPKLKNELGRAWREHILQKHTYAARLEALLRESGIGGGPA